MRKSKSLWLMAAALLVSGSTWAQVAQIGGTEYDDLQSAIDAAQSGQTIKMVADDVIEEAITGDAYAYTVASGKDIILDLNNHTIYRLRNEAVGYAIFSVNGKFTLTDNSVNKNGRVELKITSGANDYSYAKSISSFIVNDGGRLIVDGGWIYCNKNAQGAFYGIDAMSNTSITINDGKVSCNTTAMRLYPGSAPITFTMNGGLIQGAYGIYVQKMGSYSKSIFNGGKFITNNWAFENEMDAASTFDRDTIIVNNGDFGGYFDLGAIWMFGRNEGKQTIEIQGGSFTTHNAIRTNGNGESKFITGGTFFFTNDKKVKNEVISLPISFGEDAKGKYCISGDGYQTWRGDMANKDHWENVLGYTLEEVSYEKPGKWYKVWNYTSSAADLTDFYTLIADGYAAVKILETTTGNTYKIVTTTTLTPSATGNWSNTSIWGGTLPDEGSQVTISKGQTITLDQNASVYSLDIAEGGKLIIEAGKYLVVGRGGITTANNDGLIIKSNAEGTGVLLVSPEATNATPAATVELFTKGRLIDAISDHNKWQYFSCPVQGASASFAKASGNTETTYLNYWDGGHFRAMSAFTEVNQNFYGYVITTDKTDATGAKYEFKGDVIGNANGNVTMATGFRLIGNSYTAPIDALSLLRSATVTNSQISGSIWLYDSETENYVAYSTLKAKQKNIKIAPMQSFMMYLEAGQSGSVSFAINYEDAVWNNDNKAGKPLMAPARVANEEENVAMDIVLTSQNQKDNVFLYESNEYTDEYENGADVRKLMNPFGAANIYAVTALGNQSDVATDNLLGTNLTFQAGRDAQYTIEFKNVVGQEYALEDHVTHKVVNVEEGNSYTFEVTPNTTFANRFEIVARREISTELQEVAAPAAKGIYTLLGQYVGEDWASLPAGVYVVDGVKMAK